MAMDFSHTIGEKNVFYNMQFHSFYEFYFFINGDAELITNSTKQKLLPNQLVIFPPGTYHNIHVLSNVKNYERCVCFFYPTDFKEGVIEGCLKGKEILTLTPNDRITSNFKHLCKAREQFSAEDFNDVLVSVITDTVYLIKYHKGAVSSTQKNLSPLVYELVRYIEDNFQTKITLSDLANKFNYSVSHLCHTFKEEYGISIKNYILQKRLNCIHLNILGGADIQETSRNFGFSSYSTFYRIYKHTFGKSPSCFKK